MNRLRNLIAASTVIVAMFVLATVAEACPTCKDGLAENADHANMVRGYFWSILFMMSMPFLIFGGLGGYFYLQIRRARLDAAAQNQIRGKASQNAVPDSVTS